ncbi:hypothetical protein [Mesorhizobium sp. M4A.F.Ca.ET.022.05.2.1]|uniref:hypothetical protein n=1 Tax=Mesorhizobium sp. M4A.F.Ca.ET.022.05.2.1 TaxID=2496653 RepID=UPI0016748CE2|nr:hypothetical protein [Mesorhizobium sp. M4A.F.Ca.ET.022.05.2.1]
MTSQPLPKANMGLFERRRVEKTASFFRYYVSLAFRGWLLDWNCFFFPCQSD